MNGYSNTKSNRYTSYLIKLLNNDNKDIRINVVVALRNKGFDIDKIIPLLDDKSADVRYETLLSLAEHQDAIVNNLLMKSLDDTDIRIRSEAIIQLGLRKNHDSIDKLTVIIHDDGNSWVRECAVKALGIIGDIKAIETVKYAINDTAYSVRIAAIHSLITFNVFKDINDITINDSSQEVRCATAYALGKEIIDKSVLAKMNLLSHDTSASVKVAMMDSIMVSTDVKELNIIYDTFADSNIIVKEHAIRALVTIHDNMTVAKLIRLYKDSTEINVKDAILEVLSSICGKDYGSDIERYTVFNR